MRTVGDTETYTSSYTNNGVTYNYTYREFNYTKNSKFAFIFLVFCLFWVTRVVCVLIIIIIIIIISYLIMI